MCGYRVNKNEVKNMCVIGVCGLCVNEWYRVIHYGEGNFQATKKKKMLIKRINQSAKVWAK